MSKHVTHHADWARRELRPHADPCEHATSTTVIEIAGAIYGAALVRHFWTLAPLLRAAVFAQVADVVTFVWAGRPAADRNPLANLIHETFSGVTWDTYSELGEWLTALVVIGLKTGLIFYLVWAATSMACRPGSRRPPSFRPAIDRTAATASSAIL